MAALDELDPGLPQTPLSMLNQATTPVAKAAMQAMHLCTNLLES
jgi:hypothetical protein